MSVTNKSQGLRYYAPFNTEHEQIKRNILGAIQMQGVLRCASAFLFLNPIFITILVALGLVSWVVLPPVIMASGMIVMIIVANTTSDRRMWWLWRGPILSAKQASETLDAQIWLRGLPDQSIYCEITAGCFKFKRQRYARLFYLHWCN